MLQTKRSKEKMQNATQPNGREKDTAKDDQYREIRQNRKSHKSTTEITTASDGNDTHARNRGGNTRNIHVGDEERRNSDRMEK